MVLSHCEIPRILVAVERKSDHLPRKQVYDVELRPFIVAYLASISSAYSSYCSYLMRARISTGTYGAMG
jgi:hypothetical protein